MPPADDIRASDAERERTVELLRAHAAAGRLGVDELEQRVAAALGAPYRGDLVALTSDLPPGAAPRRPRRGRTGELRAYAWTMVLLVAIWAATGADYFWPMWPAMGWGLGIAMKSRDSPSRPARHISESAG